MATTIAEHRANAAVAEHPVMRWGAIFAGWFMATGTALLLYAFGLAVGFSAVNPRDAETVAHGLSAGAVVWMILTWGAALWVGGMFASWFDGRNDTEMGVVRGLTVWGLSMAATGLAMGSGLMHAAFVTTAASAGAAPVDPTRAAHYLAAVMWAAFVSAVVALIAAAFGGWMGAHHVHRVYHLRRYPEHGRPA
ncbi:MAG: hypothetical protein KGL45_02005 [Gammaproteobacteria bacterium]|nr:hypothetical protein [Gammaproteobacteria bacterium]MDE2261278.1 hypothetical protein [Gammaproteobacteria bacterium]